MADFAVDPVAIDVGHLVRRNVTSLYSSLVTRPTGQAVRLAIENVLAEETGPVSLSVIDFSQVTVMDFSCADEVVAKLILRFSTRERPRDAYFLFRGIRDLHRDPVEAVLQRQGLAAVAETDRGVFELLGRVDAASLGVWRTLETRGKVSAEEEKELFPGEGRGGILADLVLRRVVFRHPRTLEIHALSHLLRQVAS